MQPGNIQPSLTKYYCNCIESDLTSSAVDVPNLGQILCMNYKKHQYDCMLIVYF